MNKNKLKGLQKRGWKTGDAYDFLDNRKRIKLHYVRDLWGFYPEGDFLVLKRVPLETDPPEFCTWVTLHYQDEKLISTDWTEILPRIVSLGITADIASQGVEYLKKGGKQLVFNIYANSIAMEETVVHGSAIGYPMSKGGKADLKKLIKELHPKKMKRRSQMASPSRVTEAGVFKRAESTIQTWPSWKRDLCKGKNGQI